ncbi:hypothetical protein B9Z55_023681 [Caenorhabditis nigoni]|uniref:Uncharacterized protein n=1 Tax=Caenorhabditis nigoni TaxID=1611254 RepID=A0A2G5SR92_9PELO|nr:hypothetical protein B9Z55_023681 [Caenorhabditis nigoni]
MDFHGTKSFELIFPSLQRGRPLQRWEDEFKERLQEAGTPGVLWMRMARESKKDWDTLMTPARNRRQ